MAAGPALLFSMVGLTGLQMFSQYQAGKENQRIAEMNAKMARDSAALQAEQVRSEGARRFAAIQADAAAGGFAQEGTVLDTLFTQARETEKDAQIALYNGQVKSTAELAQGVKARNDATRQMLGTAAQFGQSAMSFGMNSGLKK